MTASAHGTQRANAVLSCRTPTREAAKKTLRCVLVLILLVVSSQATAVYCISDYEVLYFVDLDKCFGSDLEITEQQHDDLVARKITIRGLIGEHRDRERAASEIPQQQATSSALVKDAQAYLTALGYQPGPIDGVLGPKTQAAIKAFQRDEGLTVNGQPSKGLLARLRDPVRAGRKTGATTQSTVGSTTKSTGSSIGSGSSTTRAESI